MMGGSKMEESDEVHLTKDIRQAERNKGRQIQGRRGSNMKGSKTEESDEVDSTKEDLTITDTQK